MINILFLCTGNSARSVIAETVLNQVGEGRVQAFSAGSTPTGVVNPYAVTILKLLGYDEVANARSKSWDEFTGEDAPVMDLVVTLCDQAAGETCPIWNGTPLQLHWGFPDPAAEQDESKARAAFMDAYEDIRRFALVLVDVLPAEHDATSLQRYINARMKVPA
jgi:arsenate reductase